MSYVEFVDKGIFGLRHIFYEMTELVAFGVPAPILLVTVVDDCFSYRNHK